MTICETHALRREPVYVRRGYLPSLRVVALDIAVAEIIGEDDEDVGFASGCLRFATALLSCRKRLGAEEQAGCQGCDY